MVQALFLIDKIALAKLKRPALQELAKREGIKANTKNAIIIDLLLAKYPAGVPSHKPSSATGQNKKDQLPIIKAEPDENRHSISGSRQSKRRKVVSRRLTIPSPFSRGAAAWVETTANADPPTIDPPVLVREYSPPPPPGKKDVRYVRREITRLINHMPQIRADVDETQALLIHATSILRNASEDFKEMVKVQGVIEWELVEQYKNDRKLWDGTHLMSDKDIDAWDEYLQELRKEDQAKKREMEDDAERSDSEDLDDLSPLHLESESTEDPKVQPMVGIKDK